MSVLRKGRTMWRAFGYRMTEGNNGAAMAVARQLMKHRSGCPYQGTAHVSTPKVGFTRVRIECDNCGHRDFYFQTSRGEAWKRFLSMPVRRRRFEGHD